MAVTSKVALGAGIGLIFGSALGSAAAGMVLGAAVALALRATTGGREED